ncbi:outer envelope pore protein 24A, chloroplastic-like [Dioscorea cayenensis subsp. rotundata]|uniref:Outer envelope pore protein 24A, chloroplastic-like n=1 Tax=Dioscorea cayennensis subsp. rotundata TaxID=55577 RepID=A0AB40AIM9_DIOCR|nr:outer envelope pore protein 24A, chloroplastic-like [Dioscorea cayenensis subsp. rotundata]
MKGMVKARYEPENSSAAAVITIPAGDLQLKTSVTDATLFNAPALYHGLVLSLEKPSCFALHYDVPKKDVRFQFMNTVSVFEKPINLTYTHARGDNLTTLDGSLVVDPANKVSVNYEFGSGNCRVKYAYAHGELRRTVFEPCYDISKNAWDFAVSNQCKGGDSIKATYHTTTKLLGLEWNRDSSINGSFKISASMNLAEQKIDPKIVAESTWNFGLGL